MSAGPFTLLPGAIKRMSIGVLYTPNVAYPCPDFQPLLALSDSTQALFDNCFLPGTLLSNEFQENSNQVKRLEVFPNPASSNTTLTLENLLPGTTIELWSLSGVLITQINNENKEQININLGSLSSNLSAGLYFLTAKKEGRYEKVVKISIID